MAIPNTQPVSSITSARYSQGCVACRRSGEPDARPTAENGFTLLVCPHCGLGRTSPAPSTDEISRWYPEQYYGRDNVRFNPIFERLVHWFRKRRSRVLRTRVPIGPVLDVGCGRGLLLSFLRELGYEAHGLELSANAAWHARNVLKLDVETGDFLTSPHVAERYNAVIFWHTLEHFPNPDAAIARARELLKPGGFLAVAVPNFNSWQARLFGRNWFHLDVPRHYYHFGPESLRLLLARHGFSEIRLDHFSFEQNPYGLLQSAQNALGLRFNLLYTILKDAAARAEAPSRFPFQTFVTLVTLPILIPLVLIATLVETALGSGGTIEMYAVKR